MSNKKLGFGMMRLPVLDSHDDKKIDMEQAKKMVDVFLERGFTYFDTAWMYHGHESENAAKEILVSRYPRESYTLATKLHSGYIGSLEDRDTIFNTQLEKTGVEYFDYYLLHDIGELSYQKFTKLDCFTWIQEKKAQGLVKKIGFSYHDKADLLNKILTEHPEFDFVQLQKYIYLGGTNHGKRKIYAETENERKGCSLRRQSGGRRPHGAPVR